MLGISSALCVCVCLKAVVFYCGGHEESRLSLQESLSVLKLQFLSLMWICVLRKFGEMNCAPPSLLSLNGDSTT